MPWLWAEMPSHLIFVIKYGLYKTDQLFLPLEGKPHSHTVIVFGQGTDALQGGVAAFAGKIGNEVEQLADVEKYLQLGRSTGDGGVYPYKSGELQVGFLGFCVVGIGAFQFPVLYAGNE